MPKIKEITSHKIINSRGDWTIETKVVLGDGSEGVQTVPEGASKGEKEAICLPAEKAVEIVSTVINDALKDEDPFEQEALDRVLCAMDGTPNKSHLGGNSILSVSLATAKAAAVSRGVELYGYLRKLYRGKARDEKSTVAELKFPTPLFNILNGGKHANNDLAFQEFMVIPSRDTPYDASLELGVTVYHTLEKMLEAGGFDTDVGDEGGFAPEGFGAEKALDFIKRAAGAKYQVGKDIFLGIDAAAGSFYKEGSYVLAERKVKLSGHELADFYEKLLKNFELIYLEDPFYEDDPEMWQYFAQRNLAKLMVVADDLVVTNPKLLKPVVKNKLANAVIVKPNQVGTLTETFDFIRMAKEYDLKIIVSHRSGDTAEDTFIADLALAVEADYIKAGAPVRGERVAKYNRLLDIFVANGLEKK